MFYSREKDRRRRRINGWIIIKDNRSSIRIAIVLNILGSIATPGVLPTVEGQQHTKTATKM